MMGARWCSFALGLVVLGGGLSLANGRDSMPPMATISSYELSDALLAAGDATASCRLLVLAFGEDTSDAEALVRLANCSLAQGLPDQALSYLQRASAADPGNAGFQELVMILELATVMADIAVAGQVEAIAVATVTTPQIVALPSAGVIDVAAEPALPGPQWSGRATLQRSFNSNINGGTFNSNFMAMGLPLVVAPGSREQADWTTRLGVDGSLLVPLDWLNAVQVDAGISGTLHDVHASYSRLDLNLSSAWITGTNITGARVRPHADLSWVNGLYDRLSLGVEVGGHHRVAENTMLVSNVDASHRWDANAAESGWAVNGRAGLRQFLTPELTLGVNLGAGRVAAQSAARAHWRVSPEIYVDAKLTDRLGLNLNAGMDFVSFDGSVAMFAMSREDVRYRVGASLNWSLPELAEGLSVQASYRFSHQQSNQDIYDTNTHLASVTLAYAF